VGNFRGHATAAPLPVSQLVGLQAKHGESGCLPAQQKQWLLQQKIAASLAGRHAPIWLRCAHHAPTARHVCAWANKAACVRHPKPLRVRQISWLERPAVAHKRVPRFNLKGPLCKIPILWEHAFLCHKLAIAQAKCGWPPAGHAVKQAAGKGGSFRLAGPPNAPCFVDALLRGAAVDSAR
jgi:hypothetical protein